MHLLLQLLLILVHALCGLKNLLLSLVPPRIPKPLLAVRRKSPAHLALLLIPDAERPGDESVMEECVERVARWCKEVGIQKLSVYDRDGVLSRKSMYAYASASSTFSQGLLETIENTTLMRGPLTPPLSDADSSGARSPNLEASGTRPTVPTLQIPYTKSEKKTYPRRRHSRTAPATEAAEFSLKECRLTEAIEPKARLRTIKLQFISRRASKPAIAAAARSLALTHASLSPRTDKDSFSLTVNTLGDMLEDESGFAAPDLIFVHALHPSSAPLELYGFPPWQTRLSEIYYAPRRGGVIRRVLRLMTGHKMSMALAISEVEFRRALDEYSGAEMRLGK